MRIIDAIWEKRNLGVTCYELHMDRKDNLKDAAGTLETLEERQYMVARVPSDRYDLVQLFQSKGYSFIEAAIRLEHDLNKVDIPKRLLRICEKCSWEIMDEAELCQLESEFRKNIFKTDRIYIDPVFTREQAAQRYNFWVKDLIAKGNIPYKMVWNNEIAGFFLNKELSPGVYDGLLAGVYEAYEGSGMGYCIQYAGIMSALQRGAKKYIGHVSGNNPEVLKVTLSLGFTIKEIEYVLIKHNKGEL